MKIMYYADDGTEFDTEEECVEYENKKEKKKQGIFNEICALNFNKEKISFDKYVDNYELYELVEEIFYVMFNTLEAAEYFDTLQEEYGFVQISNTNALKENEVYFYDDRFDEWVSANEKVVFYENIINEFK